MGYGTESKAGRVVPDALLLAPIAFQTPADKANYRILGPVTVTRIGVLITTVVTVTPAVLDFDRRVLHGSDTGRIDQGVGRITAPVTGSAIGQVVYKDVNVDLDAGDEVVFSLTTASTAGGGIPLLECIPREAYNTAEMIKSA